MAIRVMIVDDEWIPRHTFRTVLSDAPDIEVVAEAGDGTAALEQLRTTDVDVVLMDVCMKPMDGVEATRCIRASGAEWPRVLILTAFDADENAFAALRAGASGFLLKESSPSEVVAALRTVYSGDAVVAPGLTRRLLDRFVPLLPAEHRSVPQTLEVLTEQELRVLELVAQGLSNAEIAGQLTLAEKTVKTHVGHIYQKLGLRDRAQAVMLAYKTGLVKLHHFPESAG
ncbi:response regulator [Streptomyces griseomycini]|uniref:DNA-binding NarL/FixJ family response regulator n=1 Tax=Streptomyces griseomycini TaxID=66895 RepID=A0A7W7M0R4_9ACTN|nr:response regulator transcription factor [Streptomyces griseomycini]MBB4899218.1 DNA-binding NarL/FixJ family response regulator [Streptomyces griseomycini]GGQ05141.1 DNA-binding response regulator [Streptomyces griseomycini]GGR20449.1 DNA-binding response regulator [Streptomyces griseomycini]